MTAATLRSLTCKDLGQMAKQEGVVGWHSMRKEELIKALVQSARRKARAGKNGVRSAAHASHARRAAKVSKARRPANSRVARQIKKFQTSQQILKLLSSNENGKSTEPRVDRLVAMVRGPYWLHASWELRRNSVERAAAALGKNWHSAKPVLRLMSVSQRARTTSRQVLRDIQIHGGVNHWYVDVTDPPASFQLDIGYLAENGDFHSLARSNCVSTPVAAANDTLDENWDDVARQCDRIYALSGGIDGNGSVGDLKELFEERLRRPMGSPLVTRFGAGADVNRHKQFHLEVDSELIVFGSTASDAHLTFRGEPIELREDGSFTIRVALPERRQVIPVAATRSDGVEQRTVVIAVERNTKVMEALIREPEEQMQGH